MFHAINYHHFQRYTASSIFTAIQKIISSKKQSMFHAINYHHWTNHHHHHHQNYSPTNYLIDPVCSCTASRPYPPSCYYHSSAYRYRSWAAPDCWSFSTADGSAAATHGWTSWGALLFFPTPPCGSLYRSGRFCLWANVCCRWVVCRCRRYWRVCHRARRPH